MTNNNIWDEKLAPQQLLNQICSRFVTHFDDKPKTSTYRQISPDIFFLLTKCPLKIKVSQAKSSWFAFKEAPAYKTGVQY